MERLVRDIESVHRELADMTVKQLRGKPSAHGTEEILASYRELTKSQTIKSLEAAIHSVKGPEDGERLERILFGCADLVIAKETAQLEAMLRFYMNHGRMIIGNTKVPALEVVPWLQEETDFDRRETMRKEMGIFLKKIVNPMLLGMLEVTVKIVVERFGFENFAKFSEKRKQESFTEKAVIFKQFLKNTAETYYKRVTPWIEAKIGRSFENLSRYHALHLVRIRRFDQFFPLEKLKDLMDRTLIPLGFDLNTRLDVRLDMALNPEKSSDGMCVGVRIPSEIHVVMKPNKGLIDVETILHELGHSFFLAHISPNLPVEFRRLYRSRALDEAFAFLFMDLIDNPVWLTEVAGVPDEKTAELRNLFGTKRLCLIRRYMGKFLAELELHQHGDLKTGEFYSRNLGDATGFVYEPEGYLIDMEPDFYALDYLNAWAGSYVLRTYLESTFGQDWFRNPDAGAFLKGIAFNGRKFSMEEAIVRHCGEKPHFPGFSVVNQS